MSSLSVYLYVHLQEPDCPFLPLQNLQNRHESMLPLSGCARPQILVVSASRGLAGSEVSEEDVNTHISIFISRWQIGLPVCR